MALSAYEGRPEEAFDYLSDRLDEICESRVPSKWCGSDKDALHELLMWIEVKMLREAEGEL